MWLKRHRINISAGEHAAGAVNGVARVGNEADIARIQRGERKVCEPFLRADQGEDFGIRIDLDAITLLAERRDRMAQLGRALIQRVLMKGGILGMVL
jgi:hypothetical protein